MTTDSPWRVARIAALEALYESETSDHQAAEAYERRISDTAQGPGRTHDKPAQFGRSAVEGIERCHVSIDEYIAEAAPRYPVDSLAVVDRNILRLAIWELLSDDAARVAAVVNEAVELARRYGGESSPRFVNGVLRTISQRIETERATPEKAEPPISHEE